MLWNFFRTNCSFDWVIDLVTKRRRNNFFRFFLDQRRMHYIELSPDLDFRLISSVITWYIPQMGFPLLSNQHLTLRLTGRFIQLLDVINWNVFVMLSARWCRSKVLLRDTFRGNVLHPTWPVLYWLERESTSLWNACFHQPFQNYLLWSPATYHKLEQEEFHSKLLDYPILISQHTHGSML